MNELPDGWSTAPIGMLCSLENGRAFKPTEWTTHGLPIVRIQNLNNPHATYNHFAGDFDGRYHLKGGELLFAWSGTPGTSFGAHVWKGGEAVLNQHIFRVDLDESLIKKRFFRYAINQKLGELIDLAHGGVGLRHVTKSKFENTEVVVPPFNEQERIADKLDGLLEQVDVLRRRLERIATILQRFRESILDAATSGKLTEDWRSAHGVSMDWRAVRLDDVAEIQGGITKDSKKESSTDEEIPYLRVANVQRCYLDLREIKTIRIPASRLANCLLERGDILFNEGGDIDKLGRGWVWEGQIDRCSYQNHVFRARLYDRDMQPKYVSWWSNYRGLDYFLQVGKQTTNLASINKSTLSALPISLPPNDEQREIVRRVETLYSFANRLESRFEAARSRIESLAPALLAKAFRGELISQDPNDEPASELLKRIQAARSEQPEKPKRLKKAGRSKKTKKAEVNMLSRKDIQTNHLSSILTEQGSLTSEALWSASQLDIDDFYDQLKAEEEAGLLKERRKNGDSEVRLLEVA